eukprot:snap_masked-scaffold_7-processed-gene-9.39-mRNA-1 protein AED:1.00 eAED:1.00 QI:0/0/0/0/1/1/2/0/1337
MANGDADAALEVKVLNITFTIIVALFLILIGSNCSLFSSQYLTSFFSPTIAEEEGRLFAFKLTYACLLFQAPLTIVIGKLKHKEDYKFYMPFHGGAQFILLQVFGWLLYGLSVLFGMFFLLNFQRVSSDIHLYCVDTEPERVTEGKGFIQYPFHALALIVVSSNMALTESLDRFVPGKKEPGKVRDRTRTNSFFDAVGISIFQLKGSFFFFFLGCSLFLSSFFIDLLNYLEADLLNKKFLNYSFEISSGCFFILPFFYQSLCGHLQLKGFTFFNPFSNTLSFVILQAIGWVFQAIFIFFSLLKFYVESKYNIEGITDLIFLHPGILLFGFCSQCLILVSLSQFQEDLPRSNLFQTYFSKSIYYCQFIFALNSRKNAFVDLNRYLLVSPFISQILASVLLKKVNGYSWYSGISAGLPFIILQIFGSTFYVASFILAFSRLETDDTMLHFVVSKIARNTFGCVADNLFAFSPLVYGIKPFQTGKQNKSFFIRMKGEIETTVYRTLSYLFAFTGFLLGQASVRESSLRGRELLVFGSSGCWIFSTALFHLKAGISLSTLQENIRSSLPILVAVFQILFIIDESFGTFEQQLLNAFQLVYHLFLRFLFFTLKAGFADSKTLDLIVFFWLMIFHMALSVFSFNEFHEIRGFVKRETKFLLLVLNFFNTYLAHVHTAPFIYPGKKELTHKYELFQPFRGGTKFSFTQALSWMLFGSASIVSIIWLSLDDDLEVDSLIFPTYIGKVFALSQAFLFISLYCFDDSEAEFQRAKDQVNFWFSSRFFLVMFSISLFMCVLDGLFLFIDHTFGSRKSLSYSESSFMLLFTGFLTIPSSRTVYSKLTTHLQKQLNLVESFVLRLTLFVCIFCGCFIINLVGASLVSIFESLRAYYVLGGLLTVPSFVSSDLYSTASTERLKNILFATLFFMFLRMSAIFFKYTILKALRFLLDVPFTIYARAIRNYDNFLSPDGYNFWKDINLVENVSYVSDLSKERKSKISVPLKSLCMDVVYPNPMSEKLKKNILIYLHGGGHILVQKHILIHAVTPLARHGNKQVVYCLEYPLSPEASHPIALLYCLRAVLFICKQNKTSSLNLIGDSAGGNLVTLLSAIIANETLRKRILALVENSDEFDDLKLLEQNNFPVVDKLISVYGLLGQATPTSKDSDYFGKYFQPVIDFSIKLLFQLYDGSNSLRNPTNRYTSLEDIPNDLLKNFAKKSFLVCGKSDPLILANKCAVQQLKNLGFSVKFKLYNGTHAFHGFPILWARFLGYDWRTNSLPVTADIIEFLTSENPGLYSRKVHFKDLDDKKVAQKFDWTPLVVVPLIFVTCFTFVFVVVRILRREGFNFV